MDLGLQGSTAFVTGASKGIGRSVARLLAEEGCDVAITARTDEDLRKAAREIENATGRTVLPLRGDMSVPGDVTRTVNSAIEQLGRIDILVTCAGSSPGGLLENLTEDQWAGSMSLKFLGYVWACRAVIPHMRERGSGSIVLVVGNDGLKPSYWEMTAGVANAADINFASSVAEQYGRYGVRINTVNPGPVNTDRWDTLEKAFARDKGVTQQRAHELAENSIPAGRICEPEEVAALVTFLASPRASFINGAHSPAEASPLRIEANGINVIQDAERKGNPRDLFWPWFAANVSVLGLSYGAFVLGFGISFWQAVIVGLIGIVVSFLLCGFIAVAGKRGSAPTMVLGRAAFGVRGNKLPSVISWLLTVGWETVLTILATLATATVFHRLGVGGGTGTEVIALIVVAALTVVGGVMGFDLIMRMQSVITVVTGVLTVVFVGLVADHIHWHTVAAIPGGSAQKVIGALVFVMTGFGLGWVNAAADYSRYLPRRSSSWGVVGWTTFGSSIAPVFLIVFGLLLAGSSASLSA